MRGRGRSRPKHAIPQSLPRIPTVTGPAARLGEDVLFSALESCRTDVRPVTKAPPNLIAGGTLQDVQSVRQLAAQGLRAEDGLLSGKTCKALFQYDSFHMLSRNIAVRDFDGHDNHDEGVTETPRDFLDTLDIFTDDLPLKPRCLPPLDADVRKKPSRLSQLSQSKTESKADLFSCASLPQERQTSLRSSFAHTRDEIEARIMHMGSNLGGEWEAVKFRLDVSDSCLDVYPDADFVRQTYDASRIETMQIKPPPLMPFVNEKEQGSIPLHSEQKELMLCASQLNFYRWLCGLPPAQLVKPCELMCDLVADLLLPRVGPPPMAISSLSKLAKVVCDYIVGDGVTHGTRAVVIHGDGSLLTAVEQSILGYNPQADDVLRENAHLPSQSMLARALAEKVRRRKEEKEDEAYKAREKMRQLNKPLDRQAALQMQLSMQTAHVFDELPDRLKRFDYFWAMQENNALRRLTCVQQDRRMALRRHRPVHRAIPDITARVRKEESFDPTSLCRKQKNSSFWGDTEGLIMFRRYLLNPSLEVFGAARKHETCVLWTGDLGTYDSAMPEARQASADSGRRASRLQTKGALEEEARAGAQQISSYWSSLVRSHSQPSAISQEAVCFPPPGFVPLDLISDPKVPWTIMPRSVRYQPTENIRVRMFRVRIANTEDGNWSADRQGEVVVSDLKVDCSSHGNPFCILFRPEVLTLSDGDQFEVVVSGLCGDRSELMFFYHFVAFKQHLLDDCLVERIAQLRTVLTDPHLWQNTSTCVPARAAGSPERGFHTERGSISSLRASPQKVRASSSRRTQRKPDVEITPQGAISTAHVGLVSHPNLEIHSDVTDVTIALQCPSLEAMVPALYLTRVSGHEEVAHAVQAFRVSDQFIVRVKIPLASAKYELHFVVSPKSAPFTLIPHPLKYIIVASDVCPNLVPSLQHPIMQKFGYADLLATTQLNKITVISPVSYRVCVGQLYFLLHVDADSDQRYLDASATGGRSMHSSRQSFDASSRHESPIGDQHSQMNTESQLNTQTQLNRQTPRRGAIARDCDVSGESRLFCDRLQRKAAYGGAVELHEALSGPMKSLVQDTTDVVHLDAFIGGETVIRLRRRRDFPDLYEALIPLKDRDVGKRIEVFLRSPNKPGADYAPQKLGEWVTCSNEYFPPGF